MNKVRKYFWIIGFAGFLSFIFIECNPARKVIKEPIKDKKADYLFEQLKKSEFRFNWLNIKFTATVKMGKSENGFNGNIRIRKDSIIWISITPALGIEAFRAVITNDSVKLINRLNDTYITSNFDYITSMIHTDIDFDMLQSLLVGNDFSYYENNVFKSSVDGMQYLLSTVGRGKLKKYVKTSDDTLKLLVQDIWLDPETFKISKVQLKELKENRKLVAEYSDIKAVDSLLYPFKLVYHATTEREKIEIILENTKVTTTGPLEFPFNVSSKYQRINK